MLAFRPRGGLPLGRPALLYAFTLLRVCQMGWQCQQRFADLVCAIMSQFPGADHWRRGAERRRNRRRCVASGEAVCAMWVPGEGIEPSWGKPRGILSPVRLPVSPPRHGERHTFRPDVPACQDERRWRVPRYGLNGECSRGSPGLHELPDAEAARLACPQGKSDRRGFFA